MQREKLKRRFGKDHQRPIFQKKKSENWRKRYDKIDWSQGGKDDIKKETEKISK